MTWLDNARIVAILGVVFIHAAVGAVVDNPVGDTFWWAGNVWDSLSRWSVPVFVMISGALLLDPARQESPLDFYRKRLTRILLPILFWSLFYLAWTYLKGAQKGAAPGLGELVAKWASGRPYYHLWFMYMLPGLYLVAPFLRRLVQAASRAELTGLAAAAFVLAALNQVHQGFTGTEAPLFINWFLAYTPYFLAGYLIRTYPGSVPRGLCLGVFALSCVLTMAGCFGVARSAGLVKGLYFYEYLSLSVIPMALSLMFLLRDWQRPLLGTRNEAVAGLSFGVYLIHAAVLDVLSHEVSRRGLLLHPAWSIPTMAVLVFALSLAATACMRRVPWLRQLV